MSSGNVIQWLLCSALFALGCGEALQGQTTFPIRIKAGSATPLVDSQGNLWEPDTGKFSPSNAVSISAPGVLIGSTNRQELYRTTRQTVSSTDPLRYDFTVPDGEYLVKLRFVELFHTTGGQREFKIKINDVDMFAGAFIQTFDVFQRAGGIYQGTHLFLNIKATNGISIKLEPVRGNATISAIEIEPALGTVPIPYFSDASPEDPDYVYIQFMKEKGITSGCYVINQGRNRIFCGGDSLERAQMAVFIVRSLYWGLTGNVDGKTVLNGIEQPFTYSSNSYFTDVSADDFYRYIQKTKELSITNGYTMTTFEPHFGISTGQAAAFAGRVREWLTGYRANDFPQYGAVRCFIDVPSSHPFYEFAFKMHQLNVIPGTCSATPTAVFGIDVAVRRSLMARIVVKGALELAAPPLLAGTDGMGGGVVVTPSREYIRLGNRLLAVESGSSLASVSQNPGKTSFLVKRSAINLGPTGGGGSTFESDTSASWSLIKNGRPDVANLDQGAVSGGGTTASYYGPAIIPGGVCPIAGQTGVGITCVFSAAILGTSLSDPSKRSFSTITLLPPAITLTPITRSAPATGGTPLSVSVATSALASWSAASNHSWIQITSGSSGVGNGSITYNVSSNASTSPRTGTITVNGVNHTVEQAGSSGAGATAPVVESISWTNQFGAVRFEARVSDPTGVNDISEIRMTVGPSPTSGTRCIVILTVNSYTGIRQLKLSAGDGSPDKLLDPNADVYNANCVLRASSYSAQVSNKLYVYADVTFRQPMAGTWYVYGSAKDQSAQSSGDIVFGSIGITPAELAPEMLSTTYENNWNPSNLHFNLRDYNNNLTQINAAVWYAQGQDCQVEFDIPSNTIRLYGGSGGTLDEETAYAGQPVYLTNNVCRIQVAYTFLNRTDADYSLNVKVEWIGPRPNTFPVNLYAKDAASYQLGWLYDVFFWSVP